MSSTDPSVPIDVDVSRASSGVWLVKMPKYLSQILNDHADVAPNGEVGRLVKRTLQTGKGAASTVASGPKTQEVAFCLSDQVMDRLKEQSKSKDFQMPPREHRFWFELHLRGEEQDCSNHSSPSSLSNVSDGVLRTVYTRTLDNPHVPASEQISFVGKVIQRAEVRPVENEQYMSMKRKHFEVSQEPTRKAQMIEKKRSIYLPKRDHEENKLRQKQKKEMGKRIRSSEEDVLNVIFRAFGKNQFIAMAGLEAITQQPKNFLQQLLKRYCNYNSAVRDSPFLVEE